MDVGVEVVKVPFKVGKGIYDVVKDDDAPDNAKTTDFRVPASRAGGELHREISCGLLDVKCGFLCRGQHGASNRTIGFAAWRKAMRR